MLLPTPAHLSAQKKLLPVFHFNQLTTADGLPTNNIFGVVRDSKGFVWIGTGNGLSRYDGYGCKTYRNVPNDSSSIASNMIIMVREDSKHRLWVGTWDAGLSLYDPGRDRFINFRPRPGDSSWIQARAVNSMLEDSTGVLWLGTDHGEGGLVRIDLPGISDEHNLENLARSVRFTTYRLGTPRNDVYDLSMHTDGRILVASGGGLLVFDRRTGVISRPVFPGPAGHRLDSAVVCRLVHDHSGNLWLATFSGLFKIDWAAGSVQNFRHSKDDELSIARDNLLDGALDRRGNIWLASSEGVEIFSPTTGKCIPYLTSGSHPAGNASMMLSFDRTGTLWISTGGGGLYWLSEKPRRFPHYSHGRYRTPAWGFESIERTRNGELWICSYGWVHQLDVSTRTIVKSIDVLRGATSTYWESNSRTSYLDPRGILWYGIWGPGLFKVDLATEEVKKFQYLDPRLAADAAVRSIAPGSGDSLWIAAAHDGLWTFDPASGRFQQGSNTSFPRANDVMKDRSGKIWIATILDGLYVLDPPTGAIDHFVHDPYNPNSLSNDRTNSLYEDPTGRIWFGAVNVLNCWNSASRTFVRFPNPAFPEANAARAIGSDRRGRLWVSYGWGQLARFDASTGLFDNFDASDGVAGYVIDMQNLDDGRVLLSGSSGLNMFDPDSVSHVHRAAPPLVITRLSINDSSVVPGSIADQAGALTLSPDQNVIELEFAALDIDAPKLVEYRYLLEGLEEEWVKPRGRRYVRYPGLRPGEYQFRVRATSSRGEWPDQEIALTFSIAPPWWLTWWSKILAAVAFLGIFTFIYRREVTRLRRDRLIQQEFSRQLIESQETGRKRLAAELHDGLGQDLLVASNELQQFLQDENGSAEDVARAAALVQESIQNVREIASALHPHQLDRLGFCTAVKAMTQNIAHSSGITIHYTCENVDGILPKEKEIHVYRIIQEALSNIVRHAQATTVTLQARENPGNVEISVADNGRGFVQESSPRRAVTSRGEEGIHGFGLSSMAERARIIGATFDVRSSPGSGTTVHLTVPHS